MCVYIYIYIYIYIMYMVWTRVGGGRCGGRRAGPVAASHGRGRAQSNSVEDQGGGS